MSALDFRIDRHAFREGRNAPRRRRNSFARVAAGLLGVAVLAMLVFFSVFVGAVMLAMGLVYRLVQKRGQPAARPARVVEGEFHVVGKRG